MFLSTAMMLDWLGDRHDVPDCERAARELRRAVERAFADGTLVPVEYGGAAGTEAITDRVAHQLERGGITAAAGLPSHPRSDRE
jgi:3-isopropylmalate dehydrogenase